MSPDGRTIEHRLDAAAGAIAPAPPPADLWSRGRRRRRVRQAAAGAGLAAAMAALVVPAALLAGVGAPDRDQGGAGIAAQPAATDLALPDTLYRAPDDAPRERAPGPLAAVYATPRGEGEVVAGVSAVDQRTVVLPGVPSSREGGIASAPRYALSPDGSLLAFARGKEFQMGSKRANQLVIRDLRTGDDVVADLGPRLVRDISGLRPMSFSGGVLMVSIDHAPDQSLHAVDPGTGEVTTLVPRGDALTFPGAASAEPVYTVGSRRVFLGAEPAAGRSPAFRGPDGFSLGPVAVSPDGQQIAIVATELYDGSTPEVPRVQVARVTGAARISTVTDLREGGHVEGWLPDGRLAVQLSQPVDDEGIVDTSESRWLILDVQRGRKIAAPALDEARVDSSQVVIAVDLLMRAQVPGVDPGSALRRHLAVGSALLLLGAAGSVWIRHRRRRAEP